MKMLALAFSALFKPQPRLKVTLSIPGQDERQHTINHTEYQQLTEIAQTRDLAISEALVNQAGNQVELNSILRQIDLQFDSAVLQILHQNTNLD